MASATKSAWKNPSYLQSSFGIFMFFCSWGIWWSFFSRWLTDPTHGLGMTSAEQGQIYSINSLATLVIMFAYGAIQDQLGIKRKLGSSSPPSQRSSARSYSSCMPRC